MATIRETTVTVPAFEGDANARTFVVREFDCGHGMRQISVRQEVGGSYFVLLTRFAGSRMWAIRGTSNPDRVKYEDRHGDATRARALEIAFSLIRFGYA